MGLPKRVDPAAVLLCQWPCPCSTDRAFGQDRVHRCGHALRHAAEPCTPASTTRLAYVAVRRRVDLERQLRPSADVRLPPTCEDGRDGVRAGCVELEVVGYLLDNNDLPEPQV